MVELLHQKIPFFYYYQQVSCDRAGAIFVFFGNVRQGDKKVDLSYIFYESYEKATLKELEKIAQEQKKKFSLKNVCIVHRLGKVLPCESSLLVLVSSIHRKNGFLACDCIVKQIKEVVPIWKKEVFADKSSYWI